MMLTIQGEKYITAKEAASTLGISRDTFYRRIKASLQLYHVGAMKRAHYKLVDIESVRDKVEPSGEEAK